MEQMGVYRLYRLGRMSNTTFNPDIKVLERDLHVIENGYAENINGNSAINGLLYEKDVNATKLYWDKKPFKQVKVYTEFQEVKEETVVEEKETIFIEAKKPPVIEGTVPELKKIYKELAGKPAGQMWGVKKLNEEINKLNTK